MAGDTLGRKVVISFGGSVVSTGRTKSLTINNTAVNVTTDGDDGIQALLPESGEFNCEFSLDGMFKKDETALVDASLVVPNSAALVEIVIDYGTYTLTGEFKQTSYSESQTYNDAVSYSASYSSSGAVTKAATP